MSGVRVSSCTTSTSSGITPASNSSCAVMGVSSSTSCSHAAAASTVSVIGSNRSAMRPGWSM